MVDVARLPWLQLMLASGMVFNFLSAVDWDVSRLLPGALHEARTFLSQRDMAAILTTALIGSLMAVCAVGSVNPCLRAFPRWVYSFSLVSWALVLCLHSPWVRLAPCLATVVNFLSILLFELSCLGYMDDLEAIPDFHASKMVVYFFGTFAT